MVGGFGPLFYALFTQYVQGLEPCDLCIYQRFPFGIVAVIGWALWMSGDRRDMVRIAALVFAVGAGIAIYHVGVEQQWWASAVCEGGGRALQLNTVDLLAELNKPLD